MRIPTNLTRSAARLLSRGARSLLNGLGGNLPNSTVPQGERTPPARAAEASVPYPGDWSGDPRSLRMQYAARSDDRADAGEVVWAWVPYEEDYSQGKDRPVLIIGHAGQRLLALQLTSKDHGRDQAQEARAGRHWMDVGVGAWDRRGRPSEVRLDRILQLDPRAIRRQGAALDAERFAAVAEQVRRGW